MRVQAPSFTQAVDLVCLSLKRLITLSGHAPTSSTGDGVNRHHADATSRAMSRVLRHDASLHVNTAGFAWLSDVIDILARRDRFFATFADAYFVVARDNNLRLQLSSAEG